MDPRREEEMKMTSCKHPVSFRSTITRPFFGCVAAAGKCNEDAHGGCVEETQCALCGATRETAVNGLHIERGAWSASLVADLAVREPGCSAWWRGSSIAEARRQLRLAHLQGLTAARIAGAGAGWIE
jgi:hypothetical protein